MTNETLELCRNRLFQLADSGFIALIKGPLFDALSMDQLGLREDLEMLAGGWRRNTQFLRYEQAADPIVQ